MKKLFTLLLLVGLGNGWANAQCVEIPRNRVLLVGDSWAAFMNGDQTITDGLRIVGHSDKKFTSSLSIAENGADTWDFLENDKQTDIQNIIDANPDIDMVHLSIGGNDLLGDWNVSFTQAQTDSLALEVQGRLETIIDFIENTRPGMHVFWPGYAYPNFEEVIENIAPFQSSHPFYGTWDGMGQPDFATINNILNDMSDSVANYALNDPQFDFVRAQGILQYTYGQDDPLGVAPGGTYPAFSLPLPLGDPTYPSPIETMRLYAGIFTDCFHLSREAYLTMFVYQAEKFYQKFFMDDMYVRSSGSDMDGSVSSAGDISQEIKLGEEGGNEVAAIVSFDTQNMADTTLSNASIFLRRESITGANPIASNDVLVKMISGNFGATANVEAADFLEAGDASGEPCKGGSFNSNSRNGHWLRLDLTAEMISNITMDEPVQFIISVPGFTGGNITFNDATNPDWAPILNLKYVDCSVTEADVHTACKSFEWINGNTYLTSNNSATYTYPNGAANGCDSIIALDLTLTTVNTSVDVVGAELTAELSGAEYQWLDCDNSYAELVGEINQSFMVTQDGNYAVAVTFDACTDTSARVNMTPSGIEDSKSSQFRVYPNPTQNLIYIEDLGSGELVNLDAIKGVEVFNVFGKLVLNPEKAQNRVSISELPTGTYILRIITTKGVSTKRIIKR